MIWEDIGEEMKTNGYKTSEGNKPGVICSQKWNYVWKTYKNFTLLVEKTGSGADVLHMKPQFYNEIREILGIIFIIISKTCVNINLCAIPAITGTAQNVHSQYLCDSVMVTQNPTRMDIKDFAKN